MVTPLVGRIAFVLKGYPRLSETFIAQEIAALEKRGLDILIVSLRQPTDQRVHPVHSEIRAAVKYLPEYLHHEPLRVLRAWMQVRRWPSYGTVLRQWLRDLRRDLTASRVRRFGQAMVLAAELPTDIARLHAHFLHTPASVVRYAALLKEIGWSGSAHAKDIWTTPEWELREKLTSCDWLVTCTEANRSYLASLAPEGRVELVYHGLDPSRFEQLVHERPARRGDSAGDPVVILSVGRLVEKKGTDVLLESLACLPASLHWRLIHVGGGSLASTLRQHADSLGLSARVEWRGAMTQTELVEEYRAADIFTLASRIALDGDRDGLPNVLMEAQSQGLPCVTTRVSAIPELIEHEVSGLLVPPESPQAMSDALRTLIENPQLRRLLGDAGRARVAGRFDMDANIGRLAEKFGLRSANAMSVAA